MSFIRPELVRKANRWRETLAGGMAAALGFLWTLTAPVGSALFIIGTVLMIGGILLGIAGIQRARFRIGQDGQGLVQVDEARVTYFGPFEGGSVAVEDMVQLDLDTGTTPSARWVVTASSGEGLEIPVDAKGAEDLFDVFASLPGLETEALLRDLEDGIQKRVTVWSRQPALVH